MSLAGGNHEVYVLSLNALDAMVSLLTLTSVQLWTTNSALNFNLANRLLAIMTLPGVASLISGGRWPLHNREILIVEIVALSTRLV